MAWEEPLLLSSSSAILCNKFSDPTAANAASMETAWAYAPNKCAHAFLTTGEVSWRCRLASRRAFLRAFSPAPADVTCFEEAQAVKAFRAASRTTGDVASRQHVAPRLRRICVAGPFGNFGQHVAKAWPAA
jgi:hypothetical protein